MDNTIELEIFEKRIAMKSFSIVPTEKNALDLLRKDPIRRNESVFRFIQLINAIEGNCSIALNGEWGSGKTMFVKQVKLLMDFSNPQSSLSDELRNMMGQFNETQCYDSYSTVYFDAWENDKYEDPLLSLMYATICSKQSEFSVDKKRNLSQILGTLTEAVTGRNVAELFNQMQGHDPLEAFKKSNDISSLIHEFINSLIDEKGNRLVIFIDELDRCRPTYAVQLLERIKHYFGDDRITFIFSINLLQLQHTIKSYYGPSFDAIRYLDKFFDLRITMPAVNYDHFFNYKFPSIESGYIYDKMCIRVIKHFSFSLRETERYMQLMRIAAYQPTHSREQYSWPEGRALMFAMMYFIPIMIGMNMVDLTAYRDFIVGDNSHILEEIFADMDNLMRYDWLNVNPKNADNDLLFHKEAANKIEEIYAALFSPEAFRVEREKRIGEMIFSKATHDEIMGITSLLSQHADYEIKI